MPNEEMKEHCIKLFPTLKRWKCTCTDDSSYNPNYTCENPECHCREN